MVGDDIIIFDESLAMGYQQVADEIGITISHGKSFVPSGSCAGPYARDFLSRFYLGQTEFSRLPFKVLQEKGGDTNLLAEMMVRMIQDDRLSPRAFVSLCSFYKVAQLDVVHHLFTIAGIKMGYTRRSLIGVLLLVIVDPITGTRCFGGINSTNTGNRVILMDNGIITIHCDAGNTFGKKVFDYVVSNHVGLVEDLTKSSLTTACKRIVDYQLDPSTHQIYSDLRNYYFND